MTGYSYGVEEAGDEGEGGYGDYGEEGGCPGDGEVDFEDEGGEGPAC